MLYSYWVLLARFGIPFWDSRYTTKATDMSSFGDLFTSPTEGEVTSLFVTVASQPEEAIGTLLLALPRFSQKYLMCC